MATHERTLMRQFIALFKGKSTKCESLDLPAAKRVLQSFIDTPETTFTKESSLDQIGVYPLSQVRKAFEIVTCDVIALHTGIKDERQTPGGIAKKDTDGNTLWIY